MPFGYRWDVSLLCVTSGAWPAQVFWSSLIGPTRRDHHAGRKLPFIEQEARSTGKLSSLRHDYSAYDPRILQFAVKLNF
jgi:hypothetical protein